MGTTGARDGQALPRVMTTGLQLRSTLDRDGTLTAELVEAEFPAPGPGEVLVRVEAAPINPADLIPMLAGGDPATAEAGGTAERPSCRLRLPPELAAAAVGRFGASLTVGLEGAGTVVAAGAGAETLDGATVALLSHAGGLFAQYCTVAASACVTLPEGMPAREGAAVFVNPMTALAMLETARLDGHAAIIHTAAASNLGQMLLRACIEDEVPLVAVVRREEQAELLRAIGARHVCDSSAADFDETLVAALAETGASVAFDAIGGGDLASRLIAAIERAGDIRSGDFSPFGSSRPQQVYIYGGLDPSPSVLPRIGYGMVWEVGGWAMPPVLERVGPERAGELMARVVAGLDATFASHFGETITLAQMVDRETMLGYCGLATGRKFLVEPWL